MSDHAIFAPSAAHRWTICTASAEAIAQLPEQEQSEAAAEGTEAHTELERVLNGGAPDHEHPAAYIVALAIDYVKKLPPGKLFVEQRVKLTPEIWGRCDVAHFDGSVLTIVDMKNGFVGVDAEENEQLRIYAAGSIYTHNLLPVEYVRYAIVQPNDFRPGQPRVKQWGEYPSSLFKFAKKVAAIPASNKEFKAGEHCRYCPLFGRCEPTRDLLKHLSVAMQSTPDEVPAFQRQPFLTLQKPIEDWFKTANKLWLTEALKGSVPPGMKLVATQRHRAWKEPLEVKEQIMETLGVDALEPPSPAQAEKLGMDKSWVEENSERPEGGVTLAFESDRRAPWQRKTVEQMFAGVVLNA